MRKIILPVAILALALSTAGAMAQTGASGTSGGAAAKSGSDSTAPTATGAKDSMAKPMTNKKEKEDVARCLLLRPAGSRRRVFLTGWNEFRPGHLCQIGIDRHGKQRTRNLLLRKRRPLVSMPRRRPRVRSSQRKRVVRWETHAN